jgi:hypothetical protein
MWKKEIQCTLSETEWTRNQKRQGIATEIRNKLEGTDMRHVVPWRKKWPGQQRNTGILE